MSNKEITGQPPSSERQELMPEDKLGVRVRKVRERLGLTHDGLSNLTKVADQEGRGISRTTIRGYEIGAFKPGARELRILSLSLRVSPTWLLIGEDDSPFSGNTGQRFSSEGSAIYNRWANIAFPTLAFLQLGPNEKRQIADLIETLYRLQKGEVQFRQMKAFVEDFADTIQDFVKDRSDFKEMSPEAMKNVFFSVVEDMKAKHGEAEADLLMASFLPYLKYWGASAK